MATTLVEPNVQKIRDLNLPESPWTTSACCGMTFTFTLLIHTSIRPSTTLCSFIS